jgi:hypothetical protein
MAGGDPPGGNGVERDSYDPIGSATCLLFPLASDSETSPWNLAAPAFEGLRRVQTRDAPTLCLGRCVSFRVLHLCGGQCRVRRPFSGGVRVLRASATTECPFDLRCAFSTYPKGATRKIRVRIRRRAKGVGLWDAGVAGVNPTPSQPHTGINLYLPSQLSRLVFHLASEAPNTLVRIAVK